MWATSRSRGFADSSRPRTARAYPSPVYSASASSSTRRTSTPSFARVSARARTDWPNNATRTTPPDAAARARPSETTSKVDGASRPSRCSATIRMSPDTGSPSDEPLFSEELGEFLRLIFHRAGHDLRVALRNRWGEPADAERIGQRNRGGGELPGPVSGRPHDRRPGGGTP